MGELKTFGLTRRRYTKLRKKQHSACIAVYRSLFPYHKTTVSPPQARDDNSTPCPLYQVEAKQAAREGICKCFYGAVTICRLGTNHSSHPGELVSAKKNQQHDPLPKTLDTASVSPARRAKHHRGVVGHVATRRALPEGSDDALRVAIRCPL